MRGLLGFRLFCCCLLVAGTAAAQQPSGERKFGGRLPQEPNQTPAQATPPHDYHRLSFQLNPGMSEQDVTNLMGQANQSSLTTCGQNVGKPWPCKIWIFGFGMGPLGTGLAVIFAQNESTGAWLVAGWE